MTEPAKGSLNAFVRDIIKTIKYVVDKALRYPKFTFVFISLCVALLNGILGYCMLLAYIGYREIKDKRAIVVIDETKPKITTDKVKE